jgi:hypothetical protein
MEDMTSTASRGWTSLLWRVARPTLGTLSKLQRPSPRWGTGVRPRHACGVLQTPHGRGAGPTMMRGERHWWRRILPRPWLHQGVVRGRSQCQFSPLRLKRQMYVMRCLKRNRKHRRPLCRRGVAMGEIRRRFPISCLLRPR